MVGVELKAVLVQQLGRNAIQSSCGDVEHSVTTSAHHVAMAGVVLHDQVIRRRTVRKVHVIDEPRLNQRFDRPVDRGQVNTVNPGGDALMHVFDRQMLGRASQDADHLSPRLGDPPSLATQCVEGPLGHEVGVGV